MANAMVGTLFLIGIASALAIPVGVIAGVYLSEYGKKPFGSLVRFTADVLNGVPSIVIGIFAYGLAVLPVKHFSALAGGLALGFMMIPIITRTTEELLNLVPGSLREGSLALGATRARAAFSVMVPAALPGIMTGILVALARIAGETAPLLFTAFNNRFFSTRLDQPISSLPVQIYTYAISPYDDWHRQAWAGALVLVGIRLHLLGAGAGRDPPARKDASHMSDTLEASVEAPAEPRIGGPGSRPGRPRRNARRPRAARSRMESRKLNFSYGAKQALWDISLKIPEKTVTAFIGPSGCGKSTYLRCLNRMNDIIPDTRVEGEVLLDGRDIYGAGHGRRGPAPPRRDGLPEVESVPEVDLRQRRVRPEDQRPLPALRAAGARREGAAPVRPLGRGQGPPRHVGAGPLGRPAAAALHRARARRRARGPAHGRAVLGARPDRDDQGRGADPRVEASTSRSSSSRTTCSRRRASRNSRRSSCSGRLVEHDRTEKIFTNPGQKITEDYITGRFG